VIKNDDGSSLLSSDDSNMTQARPIDIILHTGSKVLEIAFDDGQRFQLPFELLRVYSPSAEVQGHSPEQAVLQTGKRDVNVVGIEPAGHYAIKLIFSDGHDTGLYTWPYLYTLGVHREQRWADYLAKLAAAGGSRETSDTIDTSGASDSAQAR
jgi:DUF971 family protein